MFETMFLGTIYLQSQIVYGLNDSFSNPNCIQLQALANIFIQDHCAILHPGGLKLYFVLVFQLNFLAMSRLGGTQRKLCMTFGAMLGSEGRICDQNCSSGSVLLATLFAKLEFQVVMSLSGIFF